MPPVSGSRQWTLLSARGLWYPLCTGTVCEGWMHRGWRRVPRTRGEILMSAQSLGGRVATD